MPGVTPPHPVVCLSSIQWLQLPDLEVDLERARLAEQWIIQKELLLQAGTRPGLIRRVPAHASWSPLTWLLFPALEVQEGAASSASRT